MTAHYSLQYGRVNIEQTKRRKNQDESDAEDIPTETSLESSSDLKHKVVNGIRKPKNGFSTNQNGNSLISRDDNLILVPEPSPNHTSGQKTNKETETTTDEPKVGISVYFGTYKKIDSMVVLDLLSNMT